MQNRGEIITDVRRYGCAPLTTDAPREVQTRYEAPHSHARANFGVHAHIDGSKEDVSGITDESFLRGGKTERG